jgi:hypothetical protein
LNYIIEKYKIFDKTNQENNKKSKEEGLNWNPYYSHWKKKYKLDLNNKIKSNKDFD